MFESLSAKKLIWLPEPGVGYFPVDAFPYDESYFKRYEDYAVNAVGKAITQARIDLVARHFQGEVVDVGIGCGQFVKLRGGDTKGFDVNPEGQRWLDERGLWCDIYDGAGCDALTFWDSLEHIEDIDVAVAQARKFVFVSIPIFAGCDHIMASKHFKRDEHFWYFTEEGLVRWFASQGFELLESNRMEEGFGREGIGTYAFRRIEHEA